MGILSAGQWAIVGLILTLWLASMGAAWKVATLLASIAGELRELREDTKANSDAIDDLRMTGSYPRSNASMLKAPRKAGR